MNLDQTMSYVRAALVRKPGLRAGSHIPHIERSLPAQVPNERQLAALRQLTAYPNDGYLPLSYPFILSFQTHLENMLDERFPLPLMGTVHLRSHIVQHRPIGAGERVRIICSTGTQAETTKGLEFDLDTRVYVGSELCWVGSATMLRRAPAVPGSADATIVDNLGNSAANSFTPPAFRPAFDGIGAVNQVWAVPARAAPSFAMASGDLNPIHLSRLSAKVFGFDGVIMHGAWSLLRMAGAHPSWCHSAQVALRCEFKKPLVLPASVVYRYWPRSDGGYELRLLDSTATIRTPWATSAPLE